MTLTKDQLSAFIAVYGEEPEWPWNGKWLDHKEAFTLGIQHRQAEVEALREAMQEFVDRCEKGEIRSRYTYGKFKALLSRDNATPGDKT